MVLYRLIFKLPLVNCMIQGTYVHHKEIKAAQGIKITGQVTKTFIVSSWLL